MLEHSTSAYIIELIVLRYKTNYLAYFETVWYSLNKVLLQESLIIA